MERNDRLWIYTMYITFLGADVSLTGASAGASTYQIIGNEYAATGEETDEESWFLENCATAVKVLVEDPLALTKKGVKTKKGLFAWVLS